jgi:hypothetical protein
VQKDNRMRLKDIFENRDVRHCENEKVDKRSEKIMFIEISKFRIIIKLLKRDSEFFLFLFFLFFSSLFFFSLLKNYTFLF